MKTLRDKVWAETADETILSIMRQTEINLRLDIRKTLNSGYAEEIRDELRFHLIAEHGMKNENS